ncbi:MAG: FixJ family two-component response regulator [Akkermansiaceae bacterium]|jgi:hypothetical protein
MAAGYFKKEVAGQLGISYSAVALNTANITARKLLLAGGP